MNEPFGPFLFPAWRMARVRIADAMATAGSLLAAVTLSGFAAVAAEAKPHAATAGPRLVVYVGNDPADLTCFERWAKRSVDGVQIHTGAADWNDWTNSIGWLIGRWQPVGRTVYWSIPLIPKGATLAEAALGAYDAMYREAAEKLEKASGKGPIQVRTGWEFNGNWMIWAAAGKEADFVGAFRRFVAAFRTVSPRFVFEWAPNIGDHGMDPSKAYPGDDVVDTIGVDFYYRVAEAGQDAEAAWRRMVGYTVLHGLSQGCLRQTRCNSASRHHAQLNGQCCSGNADDHGPSPITPEAAGVSTTR